MHKPFIFWKKDFFGANTRIFQKVSLSFLCILLICCSQHSKNILIKQSPNDNRMYRYLELTNKMRILIASDLLSDKSAAALTVYRGSYHNPKSRPGLAHFLEHMLFIGTEKYPAVDSFQKFITGNGGYSNAYTATDHTNYFYEIQPSAFEESLDRFAQFFIAPLLSPEYVEREKKAVHSEYKMQYKDDSRRGYMAAKEALNPEHPARRFSIGSLDTLSGDIEADLKLFLKNNYSSDQMALVILSNNSLDEMELMVSRIFGEIQNRHIGNSYVSVAPLTDKQVPAVLSSRPLKDIYTVSYNFPIPNPRPYFREKPVAYISNLIGHEGEGSLHQSLTKNGWIESLGAGTFDFDRNSSVMSVNIKLTREGRSHVSEISDMLFQYIDILKIEGPKLWRYEEQSKLASLKFRFQEKGAPIDFVSSIAPMIDKYPPEDLLVSPYLMENFDFSLIKEYLGYLTRENVLVEHVDPDVPVSLKEEYFDVPYSLVLGPISQGSASKAKMHLPTPNTFIPENTTLLRGDDLAISKSVEDEYVQIWLDTDTEFGAPRASFILNLFFDGGLHTIEDNVRARLLSELVNDSLITETYPAFLAGLGYSLSESDKGLVITATGYNDKLASLLGKVLKSVTDGPLEAERFLTIRESLTTGLVNLSKDRPYMQTLRALQDELLSASWSPSALAAEIKHVELNDLEVWRKERFRRVSVLAAMHGNVSEEDVFILRSTLSENLNLAKVEIRRSELKTITENEILDINVDHDDAAILMYVQHPDDEYKTRAMGALAAQLIRSPYFSELRTQRQLGYVVHTSTRRFRDLTGNIFLIQSPVMGVSGLEEASLEFLRAYLSQWSELSREEFLEQKRGLINRLTQKDKNLGERSRRYWTDLENENFQFDTQQRIAVEVESLTKSDMQAFFKKLVERLYDQRLLIYSNGKFMPESSG
ncbi:MAG: hypothetical protein CBC09_08920 [Cellvibrionales bacterium TMED49]|nr:hypothetical protein [Porticoccaceae bacterium]OUU35569.1 MAG: hypothetical protein CBC09_08920 [Cellvibrionales bacterium TMED49]